jgi:carbamoyl-phosphate synthase small subunit
MEDKKAFLVLEDGTVYEGIAIGKIGTSTGEIAFNTGMTGYQEIFTDPSYCGQILIMNTAHIGNYGTMKTEVESEKVQIAGLVCKKFSKRYARPQADLSIQEYLEQNELSGISDIDTRSLVHHVREAGAMNAIISSEILDVEKLKAAVKELPSMDGLELSSRVSTKEAFVRGEDSSKIRVSMLDLGVKNNIIQCLVNEGCQVKVFPLNSSYEDLMSFKPHGIMLSNGPGDPSAMPDSVALVKKIIDSNIPVFGICLGHQVIALSQGLKTVKMHQGHRGINHPVLNLETGMAEITSQNHGFVVDEVKDENIVITHRHLNDDSIAGIRLKNKPVFSVQYHPEANPGPHDSRYLFTQFIENIESHSVEKEINSVLNK